MTKLNLEINNFGPINKADLEIGKINVIAGPNASGKTTTSKLLYCLVSSVSSDGEYLVNSNLKNRLTKLLLSFSSTLPEEFYELSVNLLRLGTELDLKSTDLIMYHIEKTLDDSYDIIEKSSFNQKEIFLERLDEIKNLINFKTNTIEYYDSIISTLLQIEFDGDQEIFNNFNESEVILSGELFDKEIISEFKIQNDQINGKINTEFLSTNNNKEAIYIETPYILDFESPLDFSSIYNVKSHHQNLLKAKLYDFNNVNVFDKIENENIIKFQNKISQLINGKLIFNSEKGSFVYQNNEEQEYSLRNTSTGIKQLGIIYTLLKNRKLKEGSFLIMDEPEVHLHPEWQIKLAEILVLLAKDLNVTLYINSHSPQFIEAIEVYSAKYDLREETYFYLTKKVGETEKFNIERIARNKLEILYNDLGNPYDELDRIIGENIRNNILDDVG